MLINNIGRESLKEYFYVFFFLYLCVYAVFPIGRVLYGA